MILTQCKFGDPSAARSHVCRPPIDWFPAWLATARLHSFWLYPSSNLAGPATFPATFPATLSLTCSWATSIWGSVVLFGLVKGLEMVCGFDWVGIEVWDYCFVIGKGFLFEWGVLVVVDVRVNLEHNFTICLVEFMLWHSFYRIHIIWFYLNAKIYYCQKSTTYWKN